MIPRLRIRVIVLVGFLFTLPACGGGEGSRMAPPHAAPVLVHVPTPKSQSPGSIPAPPMAVTKPQSIAAMNARSPKSTIGAPQWVQLSGGASQISAAGDGSFWALSPDGPNGGLNSADKYIYHNVNGVWTNVGGAGAHISAAADGSLWVVNSLGGVYHNVNNTWFAIAGGAKDISVAPDGTIYVLSDTPGNAAIYHYANGSWTQYPGAGTTIAASPDVHSHGPFGAGGFWVTNSFGEIYYNTPGIGYTQLSGKAAQIVPTKNGGIFVLGFPANSSGNPLYYNDLDTGTWTQIPGGAIDLATDSAYLYAIGGSGGIFETPITLTSAPTTAPTNAPTNAPTTSPTSTPTTAPTATSSPSSLPSTAPAPAVGYLAPNGVNSFTGHLGATSSTTIVGVGTTYVNTNRSSNLSSGFVTESVGALGALGKRRSTQSLPTNPLWLQNAWTEHPFHGDSLIEDPVAMRRLFADLERTSGRSPKSIRRTKGLPNVLGAAAGIWVQNSAIGTSGGTFSQIPSTLRAITTHGYIWIDNKIATLTQAEVDQIGTDFENSYTSDVAHYGNSSYGASAAGIQGAGYSTCDATGAKDGGSTASYIVPSDDKIALSVLDPSNIGKGTGGYFYSLNHRPQGYVNCILPGGSYHSNEQAMYFAAFYGSNYGHGYTNSYALAQDVPRTTAHELQHLINFVHHQIMQSDPAYPGYPGTGEESWVNEGLSVLSQDFALAALYPDQQNDVGDALNLAGKYLAAPQNFSITAFTGDDGSGLTYNCAGCYGSEYVFQRYMYDHFGGDGYLRASLDQAQVGQAGIERQAGKPLATVMTDFGIALAASNTGKTTNPLWNFTGFNPRGTYTDHFGVTKTFSGPAKLGTQLTIAGTASQTPFLGTVFFLDGSAIGNTNVTVTDIAGTFGLKVGVVQ